MEKKNRLSSLFNPYIGTMDEAKARKDTVRSRLPPALNPETAAVTQPYRDLISRGLISLLRVEFSAGTTVCLCNIGAHVPVPEGQAREGVTPGVAKQVIIDSKLWAPQKGAKGKEKKDGVQLPQNSLCLKDFDGTSDEHLRNRANAVANKLGDSTARGRIGSLNFMREGLNTFGEWWANAPCAARTRLLTDGKHHAQFTTEHNRRFAQVVTKCPFRVDGPVPTPATEEETQAPNGSA